MQHIFEARFSQQSAERMHLGLSLLSINLTEKVTIRNASQSILLLPLGKSNNLSYSQAQWRGKAPELRLSPRLLGALLAFFARYLRDGFASVNHFDIDIEPSEDSIGVFIVLKVDKFAPPITHDQLVRMTED
jgi:hypothetical protein